MKSEHFDHYMHLKAKGDTAGCAQILEKILLDDPNNAEAWNNRAAMLLALGHPFDAITNYDKAISISPKMAECYNNRGVAYVELNLLDQAMNDYEKALELNPNISDVYKNKAVVYGRREDSQKAIESYRTAIEKNPNNANAHFEMGLFLLQNGEFAEGWKEIEWRWDVGQLPSRGLGVPQWDGTPTENPDDILLFYAEQGHGDALQFMRYAPLIKEKWKGKVIVEVRHHLKRLTGTLKGVDGVISYGDQLPKIKFALPMMSAPLIMGTTLETVPNGIPYLSAEPYRINLWKKNLTQLPPGPKIGICWAGGARPLQPIANAVDQRRSTTLESFSELAKIKGISWVSLQVGPQSSQVKTPPAGMTIGDWTEKLDDFYDTAALIECLDLVISVDTAVVHLAGALGKPVWLLSRYDNCWRWLGKREDSPWYPSLRQFVQPSPGDWDGMMIEVRSALQQLLTQRKAA